MDKKGNLYLDILVIQSEGEYGYRVYYKDIYKEFSFYTSSENINSILEEIIKNRAE